MLSNLPIFNNEEVVGLVLYPEWFVFKYKPEDIGTNDTRGAYWVASCSHDDSFALYSPYIEGVYDNYGSIEKIADTLGSRTLHEQLKEELVETKAGSFEIPPEISKGMVLEDLMKEVSRGFVKASRRGREVPLALAMIRKDVFNAAIDLIPVEKHEASFMDSALARIEMPKEPKDILIYENTLKLRRFMEETRRHFHLPSGTGSQGDELDDHLAFSKELTKIIKTMIKNRDLY